MYGPALGAEVDLIRGGAHIGGGDGYGPWPSVEAWCLDASTRLVPNAS